MAPDLDAIRGSPTANRLAQSQIVLDKSMRTGMRLSVCALSGRHSRGVRERAQVFANRRRMSGPAGISGTATWRGRNAGPARINGAGSVRIGIGTSATNWPVGRGRRVRGEDGPSEAQMRCAIRGSGAGAARREFPARSACQTA